MRIEGEYLFDGARDAVWQRIRDPQVLASALPGTQSMRQISETEYEGKMNVRIGPVAGVFAGRVVVSDEVPPESAQLTVEGRGAPGFVEGSGSVHLTEQAPNKTLLVYKGDLQVGGKLASVGQRLMDSVSKSIIRQGLESINEMLKAPIAQVPPTPEREVPPVEEAPVPPQPSVAHREPSQAQFAAAVARDVARDYTKDLFAPENQAAWLAVAATLLGVLVGFWLGRLSTDRD